MISVRLAGVFLASALSACVDFYPDINEGCDSAADRCPNNLSYEECVDDAIDLLRAESEESSIVYDCLAGSPCNEVEACLQSGD